MTWLKSIKELTYYWSKSNKTKKLSGMLLECDSKDFLLEFVLKI